MKEQFKAIAKSLSSRVSAAACYTPHGPSAGDASEDIWIDIIREYLPRRYEVHSGFVIDSYGNESRQIDCLVFDAFYTPKLWGDNKYLYVPAEAIYAAIEIKQIIDKPNIIDARDKIESVRHLKRTSAPMISSGQSVPARPDFRILGGLCADKAGWSSGLGKKFNEIAESEDNKSDRGIDFYLTSKSGVADLLDGAVSINNGSTAIIYGLLRFLEQLRSLGTVPAVDLGAYQAAVR